MSQDFGWWNSETTSNARSLATSATTTSEFSIKQNTKSSYQNVTKTESRTDKKTNVNINFSTLQSWGAQRGWFDSHNQIEIDDEKIVKILMIFYVSNTLGFARLTS